MTDSKCEALTCGGCSGSCHNNGCDSDRDCSEHNEINCPINPYNYCPLSRQEIMEVIEDSDYVKLAVTENNQPYIIPMCFKYKKCCDKLVFYLYSKNDGRKLQCMKATQKVCLEFDAENDCGDVISVIALGTASLCEGCASCNCGCGCNTCNGCGGNSRERERLVPIKVVINELSGRRYHAPEESNGGCGCGCNSGCGCNNGCENTCGCNNGWESTCGCNNSCAKNKSDRKCPCNSGGWNGCGSGYSSPCGTVMC